MPVTVYRLENEPILIATFNGDIDAATMMEMYRRSHELIKEQEIIFRITDFRHVNTSVQEVMRMMMDAQKGLPGSSSDPRIRPILLGDNKWSRIAQEIMQNLNISLPIFSAMGEALQFVRTILAKRYSGTSS